MTEEQKLNLPLLQKYPYTPFFASNENNGILMDVHSSLSPSTPLPGKIRLPFSQSEAAFSLPTRRLLAFSKCSESDFHILIQSQRNENPSEEPEWPSLYVSLVKSKWSISHSAF